MDRLKMVGWLLAGLGWSLVALTGCRSTPKVPPERPYLTPGATAPAAPPVGFSSQPTPNAFAGATAPTSPVPGMKPAAAGSYGSRPLASPGGAPDAGLSSGAAPAAPAPSAALSDPNGQPPGMPPLTR